MISAIVEFIVGLLGEFILSVIWYYVLFPVVWLVSLPFILVLALFRRGRYGIAVVEMLTSVNYYWKTYGGV